ncbi:hypothetical protein [Olleya aquimaris]|nr:hypothetical protein [Olleya aquimaris]
MTVNKFKVMPGAPTGAPFFKYEIKIRISQETTFKSLVINNSIIKQFSVTNLDTKMQSDNRFVYPKGYYIISCKPENLYDNTKDVDTVTLFYNEGDNNKKISKVIDSFSVIQLK